MYSLTGCQSYGLGGGAFYFATYAIPAWKHTYLLYVCDIIHVTTIFMCAAYVSHLPIMFTLNPTSTHLHYVAPTRRQPV